MGRVRYSRATFMSRLSDTSVSRQSRRHGRTRGWSDDGVRERAEKCDQRPALLVGEVERLCGKGQHWPRRAESYSTATIIEIDDLLQCRKRTVVHVRRSECDVAERGHLERKPMQLDVVDSRASRVGIQDRVARHDALPHTDDLRLGCGEGGWHRSIEEWREVTTAAARLAHEESESRSLSWRERGRVTTCRAIEPRVECGERSHVGRQGDPH